MLKTLVLTTALSGLMISGAFAQATPPASNAPATAAAPADSSKFITQQQPDQWVFSKFKGTDVIGADNAHIGDVNDLLFDRKGKVDGVIVGVGGFLGIGEKNVAIDLSAFQVMPADSNNANDPNSVKLKVGWTKDQLKNAPDFQYYKSTASRTSTAPNNAPANRAPAADNRPATPPASNTAPAAPAQRP